MPHAPTFHLLDSSFPDSDRGLDLPQRRTAAGQLALEITNLDHADPPAYRPGGFPRGLAFNRNVFRLTAEPCMPAIGVECRALGFDPAAVPIQWRLACRQVLCRHTNVGQFRYRGGAEILDREWRGESRAASFTLFDPADPACLCVYNDATRVHGGHAVLEIAARPNGQTLRDYVHLRIAGTNPSKDEVFRYLDAQLAAYDPNVGRMLRAIYGHESGYYQFAQGAQRQAAMTFKKPHHRDEPAHPECRVVFDWPDDPENFPLASFDFGVGLSQFTKVGQQRVTSDIAWDWRENVRMSANLFLSKLRSTHRPGITWHHWALAAWERYNGSGAAAAAYARRLSISPEGMTVELTAADATVQTARIAPPTELGSPAPWLSV